MIKSWPVYIFLAGDYQEAKRLLNKYVADVGLCVTAKKIDFIYTGGSEAGIEIGLQNYPRFPSSPEEITDRANDLAAYLMRGLYQRTALVVTPEETYWHQQKLPGEAA